MGATLALLLIVAGAPSTARASSDPSQGLLELGRSLVQEGRREEAVTIYEDILLLAETDPEVADENLAAALNELAGLYREDDRLEDALELYRRALAHGEKALPKAHPNLAAGLYNLGRLLHDLERFDEAAAYYERALPIWTEALGPRHPLTLTAMNDLAEVLDAVARGEEAEALRRSRESLRKAEGDAAGTENEAPEAREALPVFRAQIGSRRTSEQARALLEELVSAHPALLRELPSRIYEADLDERGVWYRIQVGSFITSDPARELCEALRDRGGECLVLKTD